METYESLLENWAVSYGSIRHKSVGKRDFRQVSDRIHSVGKLSVGNCFRRITDGTADKFPTEYIVGNFRRISDGLN